MLSLSKNCEVKRVMDAVAAGTTSQNSASVNMANAEAVMFVAAFGTLTTNAVTGIKLQQSDDDGSADDWGDIEGSAQSIADTRDNDLLITEIVRPQKLYVRAVVTRGTANAVIDGVIAIKTGLRTVPGTHDSASVAGSELLTSPLEGTA